MYTRQLKKYQYGGASQQSNPQQMMQQVAQMLQQGADPQEVLQQLVQSGIPQEQAAQMIQGVMGQMQQGEEQEAQPEMRRGGMYQQGGTLTDAEAKILYKNPRYVQSAVDAEKQAFIGPPEYRTPQTQLASQYIPNPMSVGENQITQQALETVASFSPKAVKRLDKKSQARVKQIKAAVATTAPTRYITREAPYPGNFVNEYNPRMMSELETNWSHTPDYDGVTTPGFTNFITNVYKAGIVQGPRPTEGVDRRKEWEKRRLNDGVDLISMLGEVARPLAKPIPGLNYAIEKYDEAVSDIKSKDLNQMKRSAVGNAIEAVSLGLPYAKIPKLLKSLSGLSKAKLTKLATKYPFSEKLYPYGNSLLSSGVKAGMKQLPNAATKYERTLNATTKGLNAGSKSTKPLITPFSSATRTFYGGAKGLSQKIPNNVIQNLANRSGVNMNKLKKIIKNLEKMESNYKLGGTFKKY